MRLRTLLATAHTVPAVVKSAAAASLPLADMLAPRPGLLGGEPARGPHGAADEPRMASPARRLLRSFGRSDLPRMLLPKGGGGKGDDYAAGVADVGGDDRVGSEAGCIHGFGCSQLRVTYVAGSAIVVCILLHLRRRPQKSIGAIYP